MQTPKLDRDQVREINAHQADQLELWDSPFHSDRQNLTTQDYAGKKNLTMYAITYHQLADLYVEIGRVLGKSVNPTIRHLKQIRGTIDAIIDAGESDRQ